jgi:Rod binding domain-containing protein
MRLTDKPTENMLAQHQTKPALSLSAKTATKTTGSGGAPDPTAVCRKFEGFLLGELFKQMRNGETRGQGIIPVSRAERIFIAQQCETLGDLMAEREPLGLARLLRPQMNDKQTADRGSRPNSSRTGGTIDAN